MVKKEDMNDKEILIEMFSRNGIIFKTVDTPEGDTSLEIETECVGFVSVFQFRKDGSLKSVEADEDIGKELDFLNKPHPNRPFS